MNTCRHNNGGAIIPMMRAKKSPPHLVTLILVASFSTVSLNMFLPSLASIAVDLDTDYALVSLAVAGYLAITAVIQLIVGPLSDRFGRRPVMLCAFIIFIFGSVMCSMAQDIWTFLIFRMIQGGVIAGYTLSLAIVRDIATDKKTASLLGYISMSMALAPMLGPMLGGVIDTAFGWRANFYFYSVTGIVLLIVCWIDLGETHHDRANASDPNADRFRHLLSDKSIWGYSLTTALSAGAFYIFLVGAPLVAQFTFQVTTAELGFYIGSITGGFLVGSLISGLSASRFEITTTMLIGRIVACAGLCIGLASVLYGDVSAFMYFGSTILVGLGNGITIPSSNAGMLSVKPKIAGSAAGFSGALMLGGGAILTSVAGILIDQENAPIMLLSLMLVASIMGLITTLWVRGISK